MSAETYTLTELARLAIAGGADREKVERSLKWMPLNEDHRRDLFASVALSAILTSAGQGTVDVKVAADQSFRMADLMLAESRKVL